MHVELRGGAVRLGARRLRQSPGRASTVWGVGKKRESWELRPEGCLRFPGLHPSSSLGVPILFHLPHSWDYTENTLETGPAQGTLAPPTK